MIRITFSLDEACPPDAELVFGIPIPTPEQRIAALDVSGCDEVTEVKAANSQQTALRLRTIAVSTPQVTIAFAADGGSFPEWIYHSTGGRHETPSAELGTLMSGIAPSNLAAAERVTRIMKHVEDRFTYGVRDVGLADDLDAMPALSCDTHLGTCVDTHSYGVAALRAAGIEAAYVSGVFFAEGATVSAPGHCWMAVRAEGAPYHWDISHFLKYNLGAVKPVMNPKPGFRRAMSVGRDLVFEGRDGPVTLTRLSGFNVISGNKSGAKVLTRAEVIA